MIAKSGKLIKTVWLNNVLDVPGTATVMRFDEGKRRELFDPEQGNDFLKRCDFLILDESESEYRAIFVELKRRFEEREAYW